MSCIGCSNGCLSICHALDVAMAVYPCHALDVAMVAYPCHVLYVAMADYPIYILLAVHNYDIATAISKVIKRTSKMMLF